MSKIEVEIINALLDKYERSSFFKSNDAPTRRIMLKLYDNGRAEFQKYDIENYESRSLINKAVEQLKVTGIIAYKWASGETNHIISEVWLVFERLDEAYRLANRMPKRDALETVYSELQELQKHIQLEWATDFLHDTLEVIRVNKRIPSTVPDNKSDREHLFKSIRFINDMGETELTQRVFSMSCFGDSKLFERFVKPKLLTILRKYEELLRDQTEEDALRHIGIVKYPEQFDFCGDIQICIDNSTVDYSPLVYGGSIFISDIRRGASVKINNISRIITIENRANYFAYIKTDKSDDELVVYHGGQYSPARKAFFLALKRAMSENCGWLHWGDIDYGGFSMLLRLRREISNAIIPLRMNIDELQRYSGYTMAIEKTYIDKLNTLLQRPELSDCYDCIRYMIDNKLRLEQEAMLAE